MSIWRVFDELVSNSTLTQLMRDRISAVAAALFRDRFEMDERAMLTAALTASNLEGYGACSTALLEFAETRGLDANYLKGMIDAMADASEFARNEQAIIKFAAERRDSDQYFTLGELLARVKEHEDFAFMANAQEGIFDVLVYLTKCKVLLVKKSLFEVAGNLDAERMIRNAVAMGTGYEILAPTQPKRDSPFA